MRLLLFLVLWVMPACLGAQALVRGPVVSGVSDSGARAIVQLSGPATVQIELSESDHFQGVLHRSSSVEAIKADHYFVTLIVSGLTPSTQYFVRVLVNGVPVNVSPLRSFRTFPPAGVDSSFVFVFGSCSRYDSASRPSRVFDLMRADNPLCFLHIGDWDYPDYEVSPFFTDKDSTIARAYERKYLTGGGLDTLLMHCPVDYVYDDHDYIGNNADGTWRTRDNAVAGYNKYFPHYDLPNPVGGIWHKFSMGNADVFMLDLRSARSVDTNAYQLRDSMYVWEAKPGQSMLRGVDKGDEDQLTWFLRELNASKARWKIVISSVNWNPAMRKQLPLLLAQANATKNTSTMRLLSDTWLGFTEEQDSIIAFIKREQINNVIFCSGDVHTSMMDDGTHSVFPEIVSANLQNYNSNVYGQLLKLGLASQMWNRGGQVNDTLRTYGRITIRTAPKHTALLEIVDEQGGIVSTLEVADAIVPSAVTSRIIQAKDKLVLASEDKRTLYVTYTAAAAGSVRAYLIDSMGRNVEAVLNGVLPSGDVTIPIRKSRLVSGAYHLVVETGRTTLSLPFTVVK